MGKLKELLFKDIHSKRAWTTGFIVLFGTLFAVALCLINVYLLDKPFYPFGTIFSPWPDTFGDLMFTLNVVLGNMQPYQYLGHNYFPFTYVLLYPLRMFPAQTGALFCVFGFLVFTLAYAKTGLKKITGEGWAAIIFTFFCYPVFFLAERANIEGMLFAFFAAFVWAYRKKFFYAAACLLAMMISLKLYPMVFIILFAKDKKFKPLFLSLILSAVFFTVGMLLTGNNYHGLATNLAYFNERYAVSASGIGLAHSLFALIRTPITVMLNDGTMSLEMYKNISRALSFPYMLFCLAFFSVASIIVILKEKSFWRALFILTACSVWLPYVSYDYTLINLLIPFFLFVQSEEQEKNQMMYAVLFGLLFIPMNWIWLCGTEYWRVNIGSLFRPAILGFMIVRLMFTDFKISALYEGFKDYATDVFPASKKLFR